MFKNLNPVKKGLLVFSILFIITFLNYYLTFGSQITSSFNITIGFALGFYFYSENKILPFVFFSIFLAHIIARLIFSDYIFIDIIWISLGQTIINILIIYMMKKISFAFGMINKINVRSTLVFFGTAAIVSIIAGVLITNMMLFISDAVLNFETIVKWSTGYFFGITTFGIATIYANFYNEGFFGSFKKNIMGIIFISIFISVSTLLFKETFPSITFNNYSYIFIIFYIILSLVFTYRMIVITNFIFISLFQLFSIKLGIVDDYLYVILNINLYLLILSTMASTMKMIIYEFDIKNKALIESSKKLESLVYSTDSLLKLSDDILNTNVKIKENYLSRIFNIACNIFDNYDYASCYIKEGEFVSYIDAVGYDVETLNNFQFKFENFDEIDTKNPIHKPKVDKSIRETLNKDYESYNSIYPTMSEAIRFGIYIDKTTIANISFDITEASGKKFLKNEFENLKSFQKLMNSFFSINYLNYKNISLKNDIVLSLIRTLELYDHYTGGHSEEVAYLSNEVAKRCGIDENDRHDIYWAGVVHDIGKVGIDSSIINKPSKLSLEEYEMIKDHAMFGYEILNKAEDLKTIAILVKHHHEWWNGTGYPDELKGDAIPKGSQIISVCDAVSTMAKKRPYTTVKTSREIVEELKLYLGTQFSPEPTKHMIEFIEEGQLDEYYKNR